MKGKTRGRVEEVKNKNADTGILYHILIRTFPLSQQTTLHNVSQTVSFLRWVCGKKFCVCY
jgi:hypothetical protein